MNNFQHQDRARQQQCHGICDDDWIGAEHNAVDQPTTNANTQEQPHRQAHVFRASRFEGFNGLWKKRNGCKDAGSVSEKVEHY